MQHEESNPRRSTRTGRAPQKPVQKKRVKKERPEGEKKNTGFNAPVVVSESLARVIGTNEVPRFLASLAAIFLSLTLRNVFRRPQDPRLLS